MADRSPDVAEFWPPSKLLSEDDVTFMKMFPTEFPYEFDSPVDDSSAETDHSSDEDDFFASLTRRFTHSSQKLKPEWVVSGSPQSTLSGMGSWSANGSPSQVTSPPATPFAGKYDTWDLIYAAAGQVARLKMSSSQSHPHNNNIPKFTQIHTQGKGLLGPPSFSNNLAQIGGLKAAAGKPPASAQQWARQREMNQYFHYHQNQQLQSRVRTHGGGVSLNLPPQSAWPPLHAHNPARPVNGPGSGMKRECAGTGVFLPRRYSNPPPEPRRKTTACPNVLLPAKVVQALSLTFEEMNNNGHSQSHPRFGCGFSPEQEAFMARRNALLEQQRRSLMAEGTVNHEIRLPQEWTY